MQMKECTVENAYFPKTVEEFHELQKTKGKCLYAISRIVKYFLEKFKCEKRDFHGFVYYIVGKNWGGLEFGDFFICGSDSSDHIKFHELGHGVQNANVGGFTMVLYFIGSGLRYWIRQIGTPKTKYDDWYYEGNATALGHKYIELLEELKNENPDKN